jgi:methylmalonyl-CoA/ethylmalonyl-CoA epimerase
MIRNIDHVGIAVRDLATAVPVYERLLGTACERIAAVPSQKVRTAFFSLNGVHIELLEATSDDSPIAKFIAKRGEGIHHLALGTDDLSAALERARSAGIESIGAEPTVGAADKRVIFLHPKGLHGVLLELCSGEAAH